VKATKLRASEQKTLAGFGNGSTIKTKLADVYAKWAGVPCRQAAVGIHRMLIGRSLFLGFCSSEFF